MNHSTLEYNYQEMCELSCHLDALYLWELFMDLCKQILEVQMHLEYLIMNVKKSKKDFTLANWWQEGS